MLSARGMRHIVAMAFVLAGSASATAADDGIWSVSKSSGEVWIATTGAQPASLKQEDTLKPGDTIQTGRNGRVLLVRGEETILIAPNSVIGVPSEKKDGLSTTILQRVGSILLEVEKKNVKHFEVETPYLVAVVKGTQFSVTVNAASTSVDVKRGQVEVSDFKSGQIALVTPGQVATSFANGEGRLNIHKATHGLAHGALPRGQARNASRDTAKNTVWSDNKSSIGALGQTGSSGNSSAGGSTASAVAAAASVTAAAAASDVASGAGGIVNGATGNGKGNNGNSNGNNGNGNGNGGVGNGHGNGNAKH